ncbi:cubilin-like [Ptychodera flava]|uniref:cubilin-like n=1 Tax=Ptychodera flava TaxID=63121 RepID=UPI00396A1914
MYVQSGLTGRWYGPIPNSCCVQDIASMNGSVIIGIGFDYRVWKKVHIDAPWEGPDHSSCCVISISVTMDNTQWAVSIDNSILYRDGFSSPWKTSQISKYQGGLSKIYHMSSGMLLATSFEMEVLSRDCRTAPSEWTLVDSNMLLSDVFVTRNGTMVGVGIGYMFTKSDFYEAWKGPIIGNAEIYTATNGRTSEGQNFINSDSGCGNPKYLRSENGTFTSMGFHSGHPYQDNCFCQWEIVVSIGKVVVLSFEFFELQWDLLCFHDKVIVYDNVQNQLTAIHEFCGSETPPMVVSSRNRLNVEFKTDEFVSERGFLAQYSSTDANDL